MCNSYLSRGEIYNWLVVVVYVRICICEGLFLTEASEKPPIFKLYKKGVWGADQIMILFDTCQVNGAASTWLPVLSASPHPARLPGQTHGHLTKLF